MNGLTGPATDSLARCSSANLSESVGFATASLCWSTERIQSGRIPRAGDALARKLDEGCCCACSSSRRRARAKR